MALSKIDAPFFGAPKKEKREKRRKGTPFFAVGGFVGRGGVCGLLRSDRGRGWCGLVDTGPGWRVYVVPRPVCI
jgi:hypothetical protein